jgi:N-acetyl-1-D-myo-inositol-2-amino-2-deoxy-alpha-D-glucopyranoside deacetylase
MIHQRKRFLTYLGVFALTVSIVVYIAYRIIYDYPQLHDLAPLALEGHEKLLVLAPHCDDETLSSAGVILAAKRLGMDVKVVVATNGDGYLFSTMEEFHLVYPTTADFIRLGNVRQQESLNALKVLGIDPEQVIFLGYPDRGTSSLLLDNWSRRDPYMSPYSEASQSPYPVTYNPKSVYAGEDYLEDLKSILESYRPDLILYPHPDDVHADHWALGVFTRLAVSMLMDENPDYRPDLYAYLVHRRDYPEPKDYQPEGNLLPPRRSYEVDPHWYRQDLSEKDVLLKDQAVQQYESQLTTLGYLMSTFVRQNEPFAKPQPAVLSQLQNGEPSDPSTWQDNRGHVIEPAQRDPNRDFITREMAGVTDLEAIFAARDQENRLLLCARFRGKPTDLLIYTLQVIGINPSGITHHTASNHNFREGWHGAVLRGQYVCDRVGLSELGEPWALMVGANVGEVGTGVLDQIGWQLVYTEELP